MTRITRSAALAAAIAVPLELASLVPAGAEAPKPARAYPVDLGGVPGVAYATVERDGLRLVATLAQPTADAAPLRFETLLAPGQTVRISRPGPVGAAPDQVEITRKADGILVRKAGAALTN